MVPFRLPNSFRLKLHVCLVCFLWSVILWKLLPIIIRNTVRRDRLIL